MAVVDDVRPVLAKRGPALRWVLLAAAAPMAVLGLAVVAEGAEYWFAPPPPGNDCSSMPQYYGDTTVAMVNGAPTAATVLVERADGWTTSIAVGGEGDEVFTLDNCDPGDLVHRFQAPPDVTLQYFIDYAGGTSYEDASGALLPLAELGKVHRVAAPDDSGDRLVVVAPYNGTTVTIVGQGWSSVSIPAGAPAVTTGVPTTLALDRFEHVVYRLQPTTAGFWVVADRPIAVYTASGGSGFSSPVFPAEYGGREYVVCSVRAFRPQSTPSTSPSDVAWIVPLAGGVTHIDFEPTPPGIPAAGLDIDAAVDEWVQVALADSFHMKADQPVIVYQDNMYDLDGAGEMLLPVERFVRNGAFHAPPTFLLNGGQKPTWTLHAVQIATKTTTTATVDGAAVSSWSPVGASGYKCGHKEVTSTQPHFVEADGPAMFTGHGFGDSVWVDIGYMHLLYSSCLPADPPDAPTGLTASAAGAAVSLSWTLSVDDGGCPVQEQRVHRRLGTGAWSLVQTLPAGATAATDSIEVACPAYDYRVTAVSAAGESDPSNVASVFHRGLPGKPHGLSLYAQEATRATLQWEPPGDDGGCPVLHYVVYSASGEPIGTSDGTFVSLPMSECAGRTVAVAAVTEVGEGPRSAWSMVLPVGGDRCVPAVPPPAPEASDADGDGLPDAHDACPAEAGPTGCRAAPGTVALPPGSGQGGTDGACGLRKILPQDVQASVRGHEIVIGWRPPTACHVDRFLVWNGTSDLIAVVPYDALKGSYEVHDPEPWSRPHRYFVQTDLEPAWDAFRRDRAVPTDLVAGPGCMTPGPCVDEAPPSPGLLVGDRPVAATAAGPHAAGPWIAWAVVLLAALGLWRILRSSTLVRLFTRIRGERLEEHPVRVQIMDALRATPGLPLRDVAGRLDRSVGSIRHHLRLLEGGGLVRKDSFGGQIGYYPTGPRTGTGAALAVRSRGARRVLQAVLAAPEANIRQIADQVGLSHATVTHHLDRFERAGLVMLRRSRAGTRIEVQDAARDVVRTS